MLLADLPMFVVVLLAIVGALLLISVPLLSIYLRRRMLAFSGAVFDADLSEQDKDGNFSWTTGIARYNGNTIEWYRTFSPKVHPTKVWPRYAWQASKLSQDDPSFSSLVVDEQLYAVKFTPVIPGADPFVLQLSPESAMALLSWIESAPPSTDFVGHW